MALRQSHHNLDLYDDVAKSMAAQGHKHSAEECRNKTKALRQTYKKTLAFNNKSGHSPTTCPYFDELNSILHGDPNVKKASPQPKPTKETSPPRQGIPFSKSTTPLLRERLSKDSTR